MVKTRFQCAGASDPGRVRGNNEDRLYSDPDRGIFLVVDGVGGQAAGEQAAEIAVDRIRARLERQTGAAELRVREAITLANNEILRAARANADLAGMGCVLTVVLLENGSAVVGHVGDSRLYRIQRGAITKLTHDHSPVGEREDGGELSEAEAMRHPRRSEVFRDVGSEEHAPDDPNFIEILHIPFEPDSALLLCSDGLSDQVGSSEILRAVERHAGDPQGAVRDLIAAANRAGGKDNVTVLVVEGDQFEAPIANQPKRTPAWWSARPGVFIYGVILALAAGWLSRSLWQPPPLAIEPRVLAVGAGAPFGTITEALAAARTGDTIDVAGGEYRESVRLKSGVTVRSRISHEAILRATPAGGAPAVEADDVVNARVSGFRILASPDMPLPAGIVLVNSQVEVDDVEVMGAGVGIEVQGARSPVLRGNAIQDCTAEGILISGPSRPWLSHNSIRGNKKAGVAARDGARPALLGNVFEKNTLELPPDTDLARVREMNFFIEEKSGRGGRKR